MEPKFTVKFFKADSGNEPVREWLKTALADEERKIIGRDIKIVQLSWPVGLPLVKNLESGLWEIRSSFKNRTSRVIFTFYGGQIVLLHGFIKKDQKTPKGDLELARKRKDLFLRG